MRERAAKAGDLERGCGTLLGEEIVCQREKRPEMNEQQKKAATMGVLFLARSRGIQKAVISTKVGGVRTSGGRAAQEIRRKGRRGEGGVEKRRPRKSRKSQARKGKEGPGVFQERG